MKECGIIANGIVVFRTECAQKREKGHIIEGGCKTDIPIFEVPIDNFIIQ
jgi:hypothetical protein